MATALQSVAQVASNPNFRKTKAGIDLGKKLFTLSQSQWADLLKTNPTALVSLLAAAGLNVPKGVRVGADVAQIIMSGGAFASQAVNGASMASYMVPGAAALQAATDLMIQTGLMKAESPMSQLLTLGTDSILIVSSGGLNVIADLKFVVDLVVAAGQGQQVADATAQSNLNDMLKARQKPQTDALSLNFSDYHNGVIDMFTLMGKIAEQSPDFFLNYFPQYKTFFPMGEVTLYAESETSDIFGSHTSNAKMTIKTIMDHSHQAASMGVFRAFVLNPFSKFKNLDDQEKDQNKIRATSLALLSMLPPYPMQYKSKTCLLSLLTANDLTPADLGDPALTNFLNSKKKTNTSTFTGITVNGIDQFSTGQDYTALNAKEQKLIDNDQQGHISGILSDPEASSFLKSWATPLFEESVYLGGAFTEIGRQVNPDGTSQSSNLSPRRVQLLRGQIRQMSDYWGAISVLSMLKKDTYFSNLSGELEGFSFIPSPDEFQSLHKNMILKVHTRKLNRLAMQNIASFLGTPSTNLRLLNDKGQFTYAHA